MNFFLPVTNVNFTNMAVWSFRTINGLVARAEWTQVAKINIPVMITVVSLQLFLRRTNIIAYIAADTKIPILRKA
jgi:hypothetical protein